MTTFCASSQKNISEILQKNCFFNTSKHSTTLLEPPNDFSFSKEFKSSTKTLFWLVFHLYFSRLLIMSLSWHFPSQNIDDFFQTFTSWTKNIFFPFSKINSPHYKYNSFLKLKIYFVTTFCISSQKNISVNMINVSLTLLSMLWHF